MSVINFENIDRLKEIADKLGKEEILCQLSEECAELSQACLKYRRVMKGLTPKTEDEAFENLAEEIADVIINIRQLQYLLCGTGISNKIGEVQGYKTERWWRRTFVSQDEN